MAGLFDALFREAQGVLTPVPAPAPAAAPQTLTQLVATPEWQRGSLAVRKELYNRWRKEVAAPVLNAQAAADKKAKTDGAAQARSSLREFEKREFRTAEGGVLNNDLLDLAAQGLANAVGSTARAVGTAVGSKGLFDFGTSAIEDARKIADSFSDATVEKQTRAAERTIASRRDQLLADATNPLNARLMDLGRRWGGVDKIPSSSPELKALTEEYDRTGGTSFLPEVATAARNFAAAPLNATAAAAGSSAPVIAAGALGGLPGAAVGGALLGAGQGSEAFDRVMALGDADIMSNPDLAAQVSQLGGGPDAIAAVRRRAAERASNTAAAINAPIGAAGALFGARFGAESAVTRGVAPAAGGALRTGVAEAAQEGTEGALNAATTNFAVQQADPSQALSAGVAPAAAEEALAGLGMTAALRPFAGTPEVPPPPPPGLSQNQLAAAAQAQAQQDARLQLFADNQRVMDLEQQAAVDQPTMAAPVDNMLRPPAPLLALPAPAPTPITVDTQGRAFVSPDQAMQTAAADLAARYAPQPADPPVPSPPVVTRQGPSMAQQADTEADVLTALMEAVGLPAPENTQSRAVQALADLRSAAAEQDVIARVRETLGVLPPRAAQRFGTVPEPTWSPEQRAAFVAAYDPTQVTEGARTQAAENARRIITDATADPIAVHPEFRDLVASLARPAGAELGGAAVPAGSGQATANPAQPGGGSPGPDAAVPGAGGNQADGNGAGGSVGGSPTTAGPGRDSQGQRNDAQQRPAPGGPDGQRVDGSAASAVPQGAGSGLGAGPDGANRQAGGPGPAGVGAAGSGGNPDAAGAGGQRQQVGGSEAVAGPARPPAVAPTQAERRSLERARNRVATAEAAVEAARQDVERGRERIGRVQRNNVLNEARAELDRAREALTRTEQTVGDAQRLRANQPATPAAVAAAGAPFMQQEPAPRSPRGRTLYQETVTDGEPINQVTAEALERNDIGAALEELSRKATNQFRRELATKLAPLLAGATQVQLTPGLAKPDGTPVFGGSSPSGTVIALNPDFGVAEETLLHESVHAATEMVLRRPEAELTPTQRAARAELAKLWRAAKADPKIAARMSEFAEASLSEFVAEAMTNTNLQVALHNKPYALGRGWARFRQFVLQLLGFESKSTMLSAADKTITALFERPSTVLRTDDGKPGVFQTPAGATPAAAAGTVREQQTASPEFKAWFGDSKVVNATGAPLVVYTGTSKDADFKAFKVPKNGTWFTTDPEAASSYAQENDSKGLKYNPDTRRYDEVNSAGRVIPVYLQITNPATLSAEDRQTMRMAQNYRKAQGIIFDRLRAAGHDGVDMGDGTWVVLKDPTQIKSAIGNTGAFSPTKPDILYATNIGATLGAAVRSALSQHDRVRSEDDFLNAGTPGAGPTRAPSLAAFGDRLVAAFVDHSVEATNLIDAEAKAVPTLAPLWARVKDAMITWRNRSDAFFETHKGELVEPYYARLAELAKSSGRRAEDIHREAGALAQARHVLDRTRYVEQEMAEALERANERLQFFDALEQAVSPAERDKVGALVGRLRRAAEVGIDAPTADALIAESLAAVSAMGTVLDNANIRVPKIRALLDGLDAMAVNRARGRNAVDAVRMVEATVGKVYDLLGDRPAAERAVEAAQTQIRNWEVAQTSEPTMERAADGTMVQKLAAPLPGGIRKSVAQAKVDSASAEAQALADVTRDLFRKLTDLAVQSEVLSQEDADFFRRRFPNYVSFMGDSSRDVSDMVGLSANRGFLEEAEGSQTLGQPAPPLVNLIAKLHQLGNVVGSGELRRGLLEIAMTDQSALVKMAEGLGEKGDARLTVFSEVGGVKVKARIALMDTRMSEGILKTQVLESKAGQMLGKATGLYGRLVTQFVPAFAPINFVRDSMTRTFNFVGRQELSPGQVNKVRASFLAQLGSAHNWAQVWDFVRTGEPKGDMLALRDAGALLLFTDTQVSETKMESEVAKTNPTLAGKLRTGGGVGLRVVEQYNRLFEAIIPLSTFKALRAAGKTPDQAAAITVDMMNFRARGTLTPAFNAAYPFFAAAAQDARQVARTLMPNGKPNVRAWTEMLALAGLAATLYAMGREGDEDDEFGGKAMDALTTDHERNWVLPVGDGTYIKIPIGFGIVQLAWNLGVNSMRVSAGIMDQKEAALGMGKAMVKALAPTGVSEIDFGKDPTGALLATFIPGLAKPIAQVAMNKNFAGGKITYAEQGERFLSEQGRAATPDVYKDMATHWRELTGQDLAPEQLRVITEGYLIGPLVALTAMADDRAEKGLSERGFGSDADNALAKAIGANRLLRPLRPEQELTSKAFARIEEAKALLRQVNVEVPKEVERESIDQVLERATQAGVADDELAVIAAFLEYKRVDGQIRRAQGKLRSGAELGEFERMRLEAMRQLLQDSSTH